MVEYPSGNRLTGSYFYSVTSYDMLVQFHSSKTNGPVLTIYRLSGMTVWKCVANWVAGSETTIMSKRPKGIYLVMDSGHAYW